MTGESDSILRFERISKKFSRGAGEFTAVRDIEMDVRRGEFLAIIGPSGCGKSTLLNMAAGLFRPTTGKVYYDGVEVNGIQPSVGYVTQRDNLMPWRTAVQNVALPLEARGLGTRASREELATEALARIGLEGFEGSYPSQLSGGMRQRVNLARALVYEPETLLMDEPFASVDAQLRLILQEELVRLLAGSDKTVVFVTHDLTEAIALADRVVVFSSSPGRIKLVRDIAIPRPRNISSVRFDPTFAEVYEELWSALSPQIIESQVS